MKKNMLTSFKVKFRPSTIEGKDGTIYYQVIHRRMVRQISTSYHLLASEWDAATETVIVPTATAQHAEKLQMIKESIKWDMARLRRVAENLSAASDDFTADRVVSVYQQKRAEASLQNFMQQRITALRRLGREGTAEGLLSTLNSFLRFRDGQDGLLDDIDSDLMQLYEAYLRRTGISKNSSSFYMRNLRTVYNQAVEQQLITDRRPFRHVYVGIDKTVKRAISLCQIRRLKQLDLSSSPKLAFARDMFMFSFYTRGMSFVDMANLTSANLRGGYLIYQRQKTRQQLSVKWEREMQEIVDRYALECTSFLLPIIKAQDGRRSDYKRTQHRVNYHLAALTEMLHFPHPLTMYVARHSWASIARSKNISTSVISEGLGHDSEQTTQIYLAQIDTAQVDRANKKILSDL